MRTQSNYKRIIHHTEHPNLQVYLRRDVGVVGCWLCCIFALFLSGIYVDLGTDMSSQFHSIPLFVSQFLVPAFLGFFFWLGYPNLGYPSLGCPKVYNHFSLISRIRTEPVSVLFLLSLSFSAEFCGFFCGCHDPSFSGWFRTLQNEWE